MATNVIGSALHPLQAHGWSTCKYHCTVHFKDSKSSPLGDRNKKYEILTRVGRLVLYVDPFSPQFLIFKSCEGNYKC